MAPALKKALVTVLKFGVPIVIIVWLLAGIPPQQIHDLQQRPKNWPFLGAAFALVFTAVSLTFVRWYLLVRALDLRFRLLDAFRLGFLGFLFNIVSPGAVGGDLFKAFFIAREQPGRRAEAVATIVADRVVGLYALLLLTSGVILWSGLPNDPSPLRALCYATLAVTAAGIVAIIVLLILGLTGSKAAEFIIGVPRVGNIIGQLLTAARIYRQRWYTVCLALLMGVGTHAIFTVAVLLIASALFEHVPTLREHLIIVPLGMVAGGLPLAPGGFGAFELALEALYEVVPAAENIDVAGVLVALVYRLMTIIVAAIGVVIYWSSRSEMRQLLEDVEQERKDA